MSNASWTDVFYGSVDGPPIRGDGDAFEQLADEAADTADDIRHVVTSFRVFAVDANTDFSGEAAVAFAKQAAGVCDRLDDAESIFSDLSSVLRRHAYQLRCRRQAASRTLARARAYWNTRQDATQRRSQAAEAMGKAEDDRSSAEWWIDHWCDELDALPPGDGGEGVLRSELEDAEADKQAAIDAYLQAKSQRDSAVQQAARAADLLRWERGGEGNDKSWEALRQSEKELDAQTADRIADIKFNSLTDPNVVQAALKEVTHWTGDLFHDLWDVVRGFAEGLSTGEWARFGFALRDVLDKVGMILAAVSLLTGGFGGLGLAAMAAVALAKTVTTALLVGHGAVHPETGQVLGVGDFLLDAATTGLAVIGVANDAGKLLEFPATARLFGKVGHVAMEVEGGASFMASVHENAEHRRSAGPDVLHVSVDDMPQPKPPDVLIERASNAEEAIGAMVDQAFDEISPFGANSPRICPAGAPL